MGWSITHQKIFDTVMASVPSDNPFRELINYAVNDYLKWFDEDEVEEQTGVHVNQPRIKLTAYKIKDELPYCKDCIHWEGKCNYNFSGLVFAESWEIDEINATEERTGKCFAYQER